MFLLKYTHIDMNLIDYFDYPGELKILVFVGIV